MLMQLFLIVAYCIIRDSYKEERGFVGLKFKNEFYRFANNGKI